ncbi:hypothetical protein FJ444_17955 [Aestuariibacter sp. GS-14]|uniref:hypothetical protein n=1 Tax=Aestuariibacter sp. GS-14 TaxID=2590670 RepID=UPI00112DF36E|nr:hypothetical protein [Aestuariibacter sp. GS-14]TPV55143.1 hypothetical protein FJ444_17955 [Aestuariibacter sp. GS-14]
MKIVIHFGPPKTGTSTIQHWLVNNAQLLGERGVYYPGHKVDENGVSSGNLESLFDTCGNGFLFSHTKFLKEVARAEQKKAHTLLFSSEFFMRQLSVIAEAIPDASFLGFVRFPLDTLESTYNQGVKRNANPQPFSVGTHPRAPIFDIVADAVKRIGKNRFELLPFEKSFFVDGDLTKTFLAKLGLDVDVMITPKTVNTSYCFEALEVKRWFNGYQFQLIDSPLDKFLQGYTKGTSKFSLIPPEKFELIKEHYLAVTKEFSDEVGLSQSEHFIRLQREKPQKRYITQQLTPEIFEPVIQDWLETRPSAAELLRRFITQVTPNSPAEQVYFDIIRKAIPASRSLKAFVSGLSENRSSIKAVLNTLNVKAFASFRRNGMKKLSVRSALNQREFNNATGSLPVHQKVEWISHHIPKTAGPSMRKLLEQAYDTDAVYCINKGSGTAELSRGNSIWLPANVKAIHGHFRTHRNHQQFFPNAKRVVWIRDPIERAWLLLGRLLEIKENDQLYSRLKFRYIDKGITDKSELFRAWLLDSELNSPLFTYSQYFREVGIEKFDFVGSIHTMEEDLTRLSEMLNIQLDVIHSNALDDGIELPPEIRQLESYLEKEYAIVGTYLEKSSR